LKSTKKGLFIMMEATAQQVAEWMVDEIRNKGTLHQSDAIE